MNATWPFATIELDDSGIRLNCLGSRWTFPTSAITQISKHHGVFCTGLRIEHNIDSYPKFVVFWTFGFGPLKRALEEKGFTVAA